MDFDILFLFRRKGSNLMIIIVGIIAVITLIYLFYELFWGDKK